MLVKLIGKQETVPLELFPWEKRPEPSLKANCQKVQALSGYELLFNPRELAGALQMKCGRTWELLVTVSGSRDEPLLFSGVMADSGMCRADLGTLFSWVFGYARVELQLKMFEPGRSEPSYGRFASAWVLVDVPDVQAQAARGLLRDADYFYRHIQPYMRGDARVRHLLGGVGGNESNPRKFRLSLIGQIIRGYEISVKAFASNPMVRVDSVSTVQDFEKLTTVTSETIEFIATHQELLNPVSPGRGIFWGGRFYAPSKALMPSKVKSLDTPENRAVVAFLNTVIAAARSLRSELEAELRDFTANRQAGNMLSPYADVDREAVEFLADASRRLVRLQSIYRKILPAGKGAERCVELPRPSQTFLQVPQYRRLYDLMVSWFRADRVKNGKAEAPILTQLYGSRVYELYGLTRILETVNDAGYTLQNAYHEPYAATERRLFEPYPENNTFVFEKGEREVTVWYEPVISSRVQNNPIGLVRTTSLSLAVGRSDATGRLVQASESCYYTPDYVIRVKEKGVSRYLIADAKFASRDAVRLRILPLIFRYQFSIAPVRPNDRIAGVQILCGIRLKSDYRGGNQNLHNLNPANAVPFELGILAESSVEHDAEQEEMNRDSLKSVRQLL